MSEDVALKATKREIVRKQLAKLRAEGNAPAVVHDHGKESIHIAVLQSELKRVYGAAGKHAPVSLNIDNKKYTALIKEVTYKPATSIILHTVFQAVKANEAVKAEIPLKLSEDIPAERISLLVLHNLDHVEVEAKPADLVDEIVVDASSLEKDGDKLHVSDIKAPSGVTITTDPETVIASVETPKDQIAEADAALAEQAAADGVVEDENAEAAAEEAAKGGESEGEVRPGGKEQKESHDQGTSPEKQ